jgi:hypothetical protein
VAARDRAVSSPMSVGYERRFPAVSPTEMPTGTSPYGDLGRRTGARAAAYRPDRAAARPLASPEVREEPRGRIRQQGRQGPPTITPASHRSPTPTRRSSPYGTTSNFDVSRAPRADPPRTRVSERPGSRPSVGGPGAQRLVRPGGSGVPKPRLATLARVKPRAPSRHGRSGAPRERPAYPRRARVRLES